MWITKSIPLYLVANISFYYFIQNFHAYTQQKLPCVAIFMGLTLIACLNYIPYSSVNMEIRPAFGIRI